MTQVKRGRPTTYTDEMLNEAYDYLEAFLDDDKRRELRPRQVFPSIEGLCAYIKRARSTVYKWAEEEDKEEFSDIVKGISELQHLILQNEGAAGTFNPTISKLLLAKHGHSERIVTDHTSSDGSMSSKVEVTVTKDDIDRVIGMLDDDDDDDE